MAREIRENGTVKRHSYSEYGIDGNRLAELQRGCRTGEYPP